MSAHTLSHCLYYPPSGRHGRSPYLCLNPNTTSSFPRAVTQALLTYSSVVHARVVDPAQRLLHLPLQGHCRFGGPHVGHGAVGFGLQGQQSRPDLLGQSSGLGAVAFTTEQRDGRSFENWTTEKQRWLMLDTNLKGNTTVKG